MPGPQFVKSKHLGTGVGTSAGINVKQFWNMKRLRAHLGAYNYKISKSRRHIIEIYASDTEVHLISL